MSEFLPPFRPLPPERIRAVRVTLENAISQPGWRLTRRWTKLRVLVFAGVVITAGSGVAIAAQVTSGPIPSKDGQLQLNRAPAYVSVVGPHGQVVGFVPRRDVVGDVPNHPLAGGPAAGGVRPVFGKNFSTLVGHLYPDEGFVPLGERPSTVHCVPVVIKNNSREERLPCQDTLATVPDVIGAYTPTAAAAISAAGFNLNVVNAYSTTTPRGHVASTTPDPGTQSGARSVVTIVNSEGARP